MEDIKMNMLYEYHLYQKYFSVQVKSGKLKFTSKLVTLTSSDHPVVHGFGLWGEGHQIEVKYTPNNVIGSQVNYILLFLKILILQGLYNKKLLFVKKKIDFQQYSFATFFPNFLLIISS